MKKTDLQSIMNQAWQFVRKNGFSMADAMRQAWLVFKLKMRMRVGIVKFYYQKVDGSIREAFGTLCSTMIPEIKGSDRKPNPTTQAYFDTEKGDVGEWRCFKVANLVRVA